MARVGQDQIRVVVFIQNFMIEGTIYTLSGERISDFLNTPMQFIPVTDVNIYILPERKLVYEVEFLNLNKNYISAIFPKKERGKQSSENKR